MKEGRDVFSRRFRSGDIISYFSPKYTSGKINTSSQEKYYKNNGMSWVKASMTHTAIRLDADWFDLTLFPRDHCLLDYFTRNPEGGIIAESKIGGSVSYDNVKSLNGKSNGVQYTPMMQHFIDYDSKDLTSIYHCELIDKTPLTKLEKAVFTSIFLLYDNAKYSLSLELFASAIEGLRPLAEIVTKFKFFMNMKKKLYCTQYCIILLQAANKISSKLSDNHGIPMIFSGIVTKEWEDIRNRYENPIKFTCFPLPANKVNSITLESEKDKTIVDILKEIAHIK